MEKTMSRKLRIDWTVKLSDIVRMLAAILGLF